MDRRRGGDVRRVAGDPLAHGRRPDRVSRSRRRRPRGPAVQGPRHPVSLRPAVGQEGGIVTSARVIRFGAALGAAALVGLSAVLPLWTMTMRAPQYPKGLRLHAYGTGMTGDLHELNILNHYIGMPPVEAPAFETGLFPIGLAVLLVLCLLSPFHRWLRRLAVAGTLATPLIILGDLQYRLYVFGHTLNPTAPIRLKPFTPLVIGSTKMGNFDSFAMISGGFVRSEEHTSELQSPC